MIKYRDDMTEDELVALMAHEEELDKAYAEAAEYAALRAEEAKDAEELATELDLYRYWRP